MSRLPLWALFVILFVAFFVVFSAPAGSTMASFSVIGPVFFVAIILALAVTISRQKKGYRLNNEGISLLGQGRYLQALEKFRAAQPFMKRQPLIHHNLGVTQLWMWKLHEAETELLLAKKKNLVGVDLKTLVIPNLAVVYALQGKVGEAQKALDEAAALNLSSHATAVVAAGLLALRSDHPKAAVQHLGRQEVKQLGGVGRALADAAYVWAIERTTGEQRHVDRVTLFGEVGPDRLRAFWPELVAYVEQAKQS